MKHVDQDNPMEVLMVAAECRDFAKVGGLGDVVCDLSKALQALSVTATVVMPYYSIIEHPASSVGSLVTRFGESEWTVEVFRSRMDGVSVYLLGNEDFFGGDYGEVYVDSSKLNRGPFEDDAKRFAFFSSAVLAFVEKHFEPGQLTAVHCHDWHTGVFLFLLKQDSRYSRLAGELRTVFTIHNLQYQGSRPIEGVQEDTLASLEQWFPWLDQTLQTEATMSVFRDPQATDVCFNPTRAGIRLADQVTTVSPTYAREITRPDDPARNFIGGRKLEEDLIRLQSEERLHGILNGLDYHLHDPSRLELPFDPDLEGWENAREGHKKDLLLKLPEHLQSLKDKLQGRFPNSSRVLAKAAAYSPKDWMERPLVVVVTRVVDQKVSVLVEGFSGKASVLKRILGKNISLLILGRGGLEEELEEVNNWPNGFFVAAFDFEFAQRLYAAGDIFLMPSDFEPCGISQMIAMRYGCLPLVHDIGGLRDTVKDGKTGFLYSGLSREAARRALLENLDRACRLNASEPTRWRAMQKQAMQVRFEWATSAREYIQLYSSYPGQKMNL